ncbi:MAG: CehA/McbA family metallohydrolase [Melioribacteraceae bacterium]|nr:CehA/McbA family metallohydrolase [Melioribacteraceae bacterium]
MFEYVGVLHIHSVFSDGSGEIVEIVESAKECELDFLIITDHNTLRALNEGFEKWYGNILLLVGCEINDKQNLNHLLAFGINETISTRIPAKEYTKIVNESGGIGIIAHPFEKRSSMKEHPPYPWTEWESEDFHGIEIWNHMSEWMEGLTEQNKYNYFLHPLKSIVAPTSETLQKWDELNQKRKVVGIGGVDAHAHKVNLLGFVELEVFPYKVLFKSIRTHVLLDTSLENSKLKNDFLFAKEKIYNSIKEGNCFVSNYYHGDAKGFRFYAKHKGKIFPMGSSIDFTNGIELKIEVPNENPSIKLIHNGNEIANENKSKLNYKINEKGAYRVEVYLNENAWIFSNHIRIGL